MQPDALPFAEGAAGFVLAAVLVLLAGFVSIEWALSLFVAAIFAGPSAWTLGGGLAWAVVLLLRGVRLEPLSASGRRIMAWAMMFYGWALVSWAADGTPESSVSAWVVPVGERLVFLYLVARIALPTRGSVVIVRGLMLGALLQSGVGILQATGHLTITRVAWAAAGVSEGRVTGLGSDPNYLALSLAMVIPFAVALRGTTYSKLAWIATAASAATLVLSLSRTGFVALAAGLAVWLLAERRAKGSERRTKAIGPLVVLAAGLVLAGPSQLLARFGQIGGSSQISSAQQRVILWRAARIVISDNWIVGVGPDQVRYAMVEVAGSALPVTAVGTLPLSAHNTLIDVTADFGLVGLLFWLVLAVGGVRLAWRAASRATGIERAIAVGAAGAIAAFLCGGLFVTAELTFPFWIALALIARVGGQAESPSGDPVRRRKASAISHRR